jgi:hypothetical protein
MHVIRAGALESYEAAAVAAPLLTKSATSLAGFVVADVVAQTLSRVCPPLHTPCCAPCRLTACSVCEMLGWKRQGLLPPMAPLPSKQLVASVLASLREKNCGR